MPPRRLRSFLLIGGPLLLILAFLGYFCAPIAARHVSEWGDGLFVGQRYPEAFAMYHKAALLGNTHAQAMVGMAYYQKVYLPDATSPEWGLNIDWGEAVKWTRRAAAKNDSEAEYVLGKMYGDGTGVRRDDTQADYWFKKAAMEGQGGGRGVPRGPVGDGGRGGDAC